MLKSIMFGLIGKRLVTRLGESNQQAVSAFQGLQFVPAVRFSTSITDRTASDKRIEKQDHVLTQDSRHKTDAPSEEEVDDSLIQPEWLAMERRVARKRPKRKGSVCL